MINKIEIAQAVCIGMVLAGIVGIAAAFISPHADAAVIVVSTMSRNGGELVMINGTTNTSFVLAPCGISDITVPAGAYTISMKGNAGQVETRFADVIERGLTHVQFIGQANPTHGIDDFIDTVSPTITPSPEPTPTPTPHDNRDGSKNDKPKKGGKK